MSGSSALAPRPTPHRFTVLSPRVIERSDRCINCGTCIEACTYSCHERSEDDPRVMADPILGCCRSCYACVFRCPRQALSMHRCEDYEAQGDETHTPEVIRVTLEQAEAGKIPVSGAGYGGKFAGEGFFGRWEEIYTSICAISLGSASATIARYSTR